MSRTSSKKRSKVNSEEYVENKSSEDIVYTVDGPFEEYGEDSDCSDDDDDADNDEEADEDIIDLPKIFLTFSLDSLIEFAKDSLRVSFKADIDEGTHNKVSKALIKCKMLLLQIHNNLHLIYQKSLKRKPGDIKVPPGSSDVKRELKDPRFILSLVCILLGNLAYSISDYDEAKKQYFESLLWYPRSAQGCYLAAKMLKASMTTRSELDRVEFLLRKAALATELQIERPTMDSEEHCWEAKLLRMEIQAGNDAMEALCLLLCQEGRADEASPLLLKHNFTWRLSNQALCYNLQPSHVLSSLESDHFLQAVDDAFPKDVVTRLRQVFRPDSPFWREHSYDSVANASRTVGYFSYLYPMRQRQALVYVEQVIDAIYPIVARMFPEVRDCTVVEWWVHTRPHCSGHQLHFDSDETLIEDSLRRKRTAAPKHPIASAVLYLSDNVGGPTLVTDQVLGGPLATKGWLCAPREGRLAAFDAKYLHGVLPGRGLPPADTGSNCRRLTFMVALRRR